MARTHHQLCLRPVAFVSSPLAYLMNFSVNRHGHIATAKSLQFAHERRSRTRVAMYYERLAQAPGDWSCPVHKLVPVSVSAVPAGDLNAGAERILIAEDLYHRLPFHQSPAQSVRCLPADNQDCATWIPDVMLEVVQYPPRFAHPGCTNDYSGPLHYVQHL